MIEKINEELLFKYGTYILFPLFILYPSIHSEMFLFYLFLTLIKIKKTGYKKSGLELYIGLAIVGLGVSFLGNWQSKIIKQVFSVAKILVFPLFIYQFNPIRELEKKLLGLFNILGVYGILEFLVLKSKTMTPGSNRYFSYLGFFMDSSVVALSGYIYCFIYLLQKKEKSKIEKIVSAVGIFIFSYLVLLHQVRATYLSFVFVNILILVYLFIKIDRNKKIILILVLLFLGGVGLKSYKEISSSNNVYVKRIKSIGDTKKNHSNIARFYFWKTAVKTFKTSPINGIGYRRFNMNNIPVEPKYKNEFYHAHSELFSMLAEVGVVGTLLWYVFKLKILQLLYLERKKTLGLFLLLTFIAFEVQTFFEVYLVAKNTYRYLLLLLGFVYTNLKKEEN
ncbi:O-antigen ligase family protein [uncultured Cetobacterium sp.]|uniref:O-antigen ligase family protein n=1 Tax=uncultured Cetobacterium sp. TaxID=527638 RepID=UPI0025F861E4|nr:O-antigen ligase family protein [uncultured Cetobacterium sp.]